MKVLYVSGKYRDPRGAWYVRKNVERSAEVAVTLWQLGYAVICPHKNTELFEGPIDDPIIIAGDCELVTRADGLVVIPGWETSEGTRIEWKAAWDSNKPIFYWPQHTPELVKWARDEYDITKHLNNQWKHPDIATLEIESHRRA